MAVVKKMSPENFPALPSARPFPGPPPGSPYAGATPVDRSRAAYAAVASGRASTLASNVSPYLAMLLDPHDKTKQCRYPDETIAATGLVQLVTSETYTLTNANAGSFACGLRWKCARDNPGGFDTYPIATAADLAMSIVNGSYNSWTGYGTPQTQWADLSAVDRTLACGIRLRLIGLPQSTFLPSGRIYFLQIQQRENWNSYATEANCLQAVTAGKGFSVTVNELSRTDGVTLPYLPQGPMSFVFSDTDADAPVLAGNPAYGVASTVVSANGALLVIGFGLQDGQSVQIEYAHQIEYVPRPSAAGVISTYAEPPSAGARDAIARGAQLIQTAIAGAKTMGRVAPVVTGGGTSVLSSLAKAAVGLIPSGSAIVGLAKSASEALGAPAWLKSALSMMA